MQEHRPHECPRLARQILNAGTELREPMGTIASDAAKLQYSMIRYGCCCSRLSMTRLEAGGRRSRWRSKSGMRPRQPRSVSPVTILQSLVRLNGVAPSRQSNSRHNFSKLAIVTHDRSEQMDAPGHITATALEREARDVTSDNKQTASSARKRICEIRKR